MSSDANKLKDKLKIEGMLTDDEVEKFNSTPEVNRYTNSNNKGLVAKPTSELVELPGDLGRMKLAYGEMFPPTMNDYEIELAQIRKWEPLIKSNTKPTREEAKTQLTFHYKQAIAIGHEKFARGWNRWSDGILEMFLSPKIKKVLWGSGNCGKSAIVALLLYVKWRVNPKGRKIMLASKVVQDAKGRVWGYIKNLHQDAPASYDEEFKLIDGGKEKGIFQMTLDKKTGKMARNDQACIVLVPIKVSGKDAQIGTNLLGQHPSDWLCIGFDECQELPASRMRQIFNNWFTNDNIEIFGWGNPQPIEFYNKDSHDLLYNLGFGDVTLETIRKYEKKSEETFIRETKDTYLLHFSMLDSPKDDAEEVYNYMEFDGVKKKRLHFIAGKENSKVIAESDCVVGGPEWYSQVLGFPYIETSGQGSKGVLSPYTVKTAREYPLQWHTREGELEMFMGVDPSVNGVKDPCCIEICAMGEMMDGRKGIDLMSGKLSRKVKYREGEDFTDTMVQSIYTLSQEYNIPLKNIAIELPGGGDTLQYALQKKLEEGFWRKDVADGQRFYIYDPRNGVTERPLFRSLGKMRPAKEIVDRRVTESWMGVRCAFQTRQIFNVSETIIKQMYNRYLLSNSNNTKAKLEKKDDMIKRGLKSPNEADALAAMVDLMRSRGFSYKYYNKAGYTYKHGPLAENIIDKAQLEQRMSIISNMMGITNNFPQKKGTKKTRKTKKNQV